MHKSAESVKSTVNSNQGVFLRLIAMSLVTATHYTIYSVLSVFIFYSDNPSVKYLELLLSVTVPVLAVFNPMVNHVFTNSFFSQYKEYQVVAFAWLKEKCQILIRKHFV